MKSVSHSLVMASFMLVGGKLGAIRGVKQIWLFRISCGRRRNLPGRFLLASVWRRQSSWQMVRTTWIPKEPKIFIVCVLIDGVGTLAAAISWNNLSEATIQLLAVVLGIFLGALAIQLMLNGLADVGAITLSGGH